VGGVFVKKKRENCVSRGRDVPYYVKKKRDRDLERKKKKEKSTQERTRVAPTRKGGRSIASKMKVGHTFPSNRRKRGGEPKPDQAAEKAETKKDAPCDGKSQKDKLEGGGAQSRRKGGERPIYQERKDEKKVMGPSDPGRLGGGGETRANRIKENDHIDRKKKKNGKLHGNNKRPPEDFSGEPPRTGEKHHLGSPSGGKVHIRSHQQTPNRKKRRLPKTKDLPGEVETVDLGPNGTKGKKGFPFPEGDLLAEGEQGDVGRSHPTQKSSYTQGGLFSNPTRSKKKRRGD